MSFLRGVKDTIQVKLIAEVQGDMGRVIKVPFRARFKKLRTDETKAVLERIKDGAASDDDLVREYLVDWSEMPGENGDEVEFSPEMLTEAMQVREYREALVRGFMLVTFGREVAYAKN